MHNSNPASGWITRFAPLAAPGASVLDVACGSGRHLRWWAERGHPVTGLDRDAIATQGLHALGNIVLADLENAPWPLPGQQFGVVVVTNYLWRPLMPTLLDSLAPGGVLIYETFTQGHETVGKPSRPDFLLRPGELLELCRKLRIVAFEDGFQEGPPGQAPRFVQRIAAVRESVNPAGLSDSGSPKVSGPRRYPLL